MPDAWGQQKKVGISKKYNSVSVSEQGVDELAALR